MANKARQLMDFARYKYSEKFVVVAYGAKVPVVGKVRCGILRQDFHRKMK